MTGSSAPPDKTGPLRAAVAPDAMRAAMRLRRPVFRDPWDSPGDMGFAYLIVSIVNPLLLYLGAQGLGVAGLDSRWPLGVFMAAGLVGGVGLVTIVGRERSSLSVDVVAVAVWLFLGLVIAPLVGLALPAGVAVACYGAMLGAIFILVRFWGRFPAAFHRSLSWPTTWSLLALFFSYTWHELFLYP